MKLALLVFLLIWLSITEVRSINITSVSSGNWNDPATWNCACIPANDDDMTIAAGHTITLISNTEARSLNISAPDAVINIGSFTLDVKRTSFNQGTITGTGTLLFGSGIIRTFTNTGTISISNIEVVTGSTFENSATVTLTGNIIITGGKWTNAASSTINIAGTITGAPANFSGSAGGNNVNYNRAGDQSVLGATYYNLTLSNSGIKTLTGNTNITENLTITGSSQLDVSASNYSIAIAGNWTNTSSSPDGFIERSGTVLFNNTIGEPQSIIKGSEETFYGLTLNNASENIVIENDIAVSSLLTLSSGDLLLNNNRLTLGTVSAISGGSANSYIRVDGSSTLRKLYTAGSGDNTTRSFPIGDADEYNPLTLKLNTTTVISSGGSISMQLTDSTHPSLAAFPGASFLSKYWTLSSANITGINFDISYIYSQADVTGDEASLRAALWTGTGPLWLQVGTINTATNTASGSGVTMFGQFSGVSSAPLPIGLLNFTASSKGNSVGLNWTTTSEINNNYFTIERTSNGVNFEKIAQVEGGGTSSTMQSYHYNDELPLDGVSYYRLKQTDFDGRYSYSKPVAVDRNKQVTSNIPVIYPNPVANGTIYIKGLNTKAILRLYDHTGKEFFFINEMVTDHKKIPFDVLSPGIYLLVLATATEQYSQRLIIP